VTATNTADVTPGCNKGTHKVQTGSPNNGENKIYYEDGSTYTQYFTTGCQVTGSAYLHKSGETFALHGALAVSPELGSMIFGARFPDNGSGGGSTGGTLTFSIGGTSVTGISYGEQFTPNPYEVIVSNSSATGTLTVTLGSPP
jgi:hypothetical protein